MQRFTPLLRPLRIASLPVASSSLTSRSGTSFLPSCRHMARVSRVNTRAGGSVMSQVSESTPGRNLVIGGLALAGVAGIGVFGASIARGATSAGMVNDNTIWPKYVQERIASTFTAFGASVIFTGVATVALFNAGAHMMMAGRPIMSLVVCIGTMMASSALVHAIPAENTVGKYGALALFGSTVGFTLCPLMVLGGPLMLRAAAVTGGIVGSLAFVAANSPSDQFLWMGGPLAMGLGAIVISSLGASFLPNVAVASAMHKVSLYGGLAVFSGFVLYDTSRIVEKAKRSAKYDPVAESMSIFMDAVNLFVRIVQIMAMNNSNRRK
eukprot:TRINITY_DN5137_c0_g1_i1.p1 TRINITY_DN5137_c0_g1~~TRINITY_DN5137_c0_g1_i1.p1  ORF type:complete len:336 (+),score=65.93 TRINITY_DN5137_c0_g1_i1:37-1008(+)